MLQAATPGAACTSPAAALTESAGWQARLQLGFARRETGSFLAHRHHYGPLRVQRPLYPEGPDICHAVIVHPPGGVAGGDSLHIDIDVGAHSHAVLATPGATKWYKSNHRQASQHIELTVEPGARLDWLPQNNILFDAALARSDLTASIAPDASAIGWETTQLGRQASGERWQQGRLHASTTLTRPGGELLWTERALLDATDPMRDACQGLGGWNTFGTLWAVAAENRGAPLRFMGQPDKVDDDTDATRDLAALLDALNALMPFDPEEGEHGIRGGVTRLPNGVILVRAVARRMEDLQTLFVRCWHLLRPAIHGVASRPLRLWNT